MAEAQSAGMEVLYTFNGFFQLKAIHLLYYLGLLIKAYCEISSGRLISNRGLSFNKPVHLSS